MHKTVSKAFLDYRRAILFSSKFEVVKYLPQYKKGINLFNRYIFKTRLLFINAVEKNCARDDFLNIYFASNNACISTALLYEETTEIGHFIFYLHPRIKVLPPKKELLKNQIDFFLCKPFMSVTNIRRLPKEMLPIGN